MKDVVGHNKFQQPIGHLEFACAVDGCNRRHLEPYMTLEERTNIEGTGFLCKDHLGIYEWGSRLTSKVDESTELAAKLLADPKGARDADELKAGKELFLQAAKWVIVRRCPEYNDYLMVKKDRVLSKKVIVPGFTVRKLEEVEDVDPFAKGFE